MNIPGISERTIRRDIAASGISLTSQIQVCQDACKSKVLHASLQSVVLDEACLAHPDSWWWVKADGCDITQGLKESTKLEWSGDVDLNDGKLQNQYQAYRARLAFIENIGLEESNETIVKNQLKDVLRDMI